MELDRNFRMVDLIEPRSDGIEDALHLRWPARVFDQVDVVVIESVTRAPFPKSRDPVESVGQRCSERHRLKPNHCPRSIHILTSIAPISRLACAGVRECPSTYPVV